MTLNEDSTSWLSMKKLMPSGKTPKKLLIRPFLLLKKENSPCNFLNFRMSIILVSDAMDVDTLYRYLI